MVTTRRNMRNKHPGGTNLFREIDSIIHSAKRKKRSKSDGDDSNDHDHDHEDTHADDTHEDDTHEDDTRHDTNEDGDTNIVDGEKQHSSSPTKTATKQSTKSSRKRSASHDDAHVAVARKNKNDGADKVQNDGDSSKDKTTATNTRKRSQSVGSYFGEETKKSPPKRGRGRPKKNPLPEATDAPDAEDSDKADATPPSSLKRGRGRPRKNLSPPPSSSSPVDATSTDPAAAEGNPPQEKSPSKKSPKKTRNNSRDLTEDVADKSKGGDNDESNTNVTSPKKKEEATPTKSPTKNSKRAKSPTPSKESTPDKRKATDDNNGTSTPSSSVLETTTASAKSKSKRAKSPTPSKPSPEKKKATGDNDGTTTPSSAVLETKTMSAQSKSKLKKSPTPSKGTPGKKKETDDNGTKTSSSLALATEPAKHNKKRPHMASDKKIKANLKKSKKQKTTQQQKKMKNELTSFIPGYTAPLSLDSSSTLSHQRPGLEGLRKLALATDKTTARFVKGTVANRQQTRGILVAKAAATGTGTDIVASSFKKGAKRDAPPNAGEKWFGMIPTPLTEEVKRDLTVIRNRNYLDPKRFYKSSDKASPFVQVGTVVEGTGEYFSSRLTNKQRRSNLTEELMADPAAADYTKRKYTSMMQEREAKSKKQKFHKKRGKRMHA